MNDSIAKQTPSQKHSLAALGGWLLLCFAASAIGAFFSPGQWYIELNKPSWHPPSWVFGPVWTVLYTLMAIAAWMVWKKGGFAEQSKPLTLFLVQLALNALWSPLFFGLYSPALAFVDIVLLWCTLAFTIYAFWQVRPLAGALLLPYIAWVSFAAVLNGTLWQLNA